MTFRGGLARFALLAAAAVATAASPTPSPELSLLLATAPPGYVEDTESAGTPIGRFDAPAYLTYLAPDDPKETAATLKRDGFVAGYGKSWTDAQTGAGFAELVVAFGGGRGARDWLTSTKQTVRKDPYYAGEIKVGGIGEYLGVRYVDPSSSAHADVVSFVKGNDFFLVGFVSNADMEPAVVGQSKTQYEFAPSASIPSSQWPENAAPVSRTAIIAAGAAVAFLFVVGLAIVAVWLGRRARLTR